VSNSVLGHPDPNELHVPGTREAAGLGVHFVKEVVEDDHHLLELVPLLPSPVVNVLVERQLGVT